MVSISPGPHQSAEVPIKDSRIVFPVPLLSLWWLGRGAQGSFKLLPGPLSQKGCTLGVWAYQVERCRSALRPGTVPSAARPHSLRGSLERPAVQAWTGSLKLRSPGLDSSHRLWASQPSRGLCDPSVPRYIMEHPWFTGKCGRGVSLRKESECSFNQTFSSVTNVAQLR